VLQAGLEVVHHCPLEVLDAVRLPQNVALIWIQLQGVIGFHLHQSAQELRAVLEMYPGFGQRHTYIEIRGEKIELKTKRVTKSHHLQFHEE